MDWNRFGRFAVARFAPVVSVVCALAPCSAKPETVARALGSFVNQTGVWNIDENGDWTHNESQRLIFASNIGNSWHHAGKVYIPQFLENPTNYVHIYSINGGKLATLPVLVDTDNSNKKSGIQEVCVTPDGRYVFATMGETVNVWRYDLSQGTSSGVWEKFASLGKTCLRSVVPDEAGHVFVAGRNDNKIFCFDWKTGEQKWAYSISGVSVTGLAYNPADDYLYWVGHAGNYGRLHPDGSNAEKYQADSSDTLMRPGWAWGLCIVNGKPCVNFYNAGSNHRITEISTWPSTFRKVGDPPNANGGNGLASIRETPSACWRFNEGTNSAAVADWFGAAGPIWARAGLRTGATAVPEYGVAVGSAYFSGAYSRAVMSASKHLVPATGDFTVSFWFGLPAAAEWSGAPRILFSNDSGRDGALSVVAGTGSLNPNALGLSFSPAGSAGVSIAASSAVADGAWHHVALVRRGGTAFELWLDGALAGTAACAASDAVAQDADWHFGCSADERRGFAGAGAFLGEVRCFSSAISSNEIYWIARERHYAAPSCPAAPDATAALPAGMGTEIARMAAGEAPLGAPCLFVASDGSYWVAADRAYGAFAADNATAFWRSTDRGATWSAVGTLAAGGVSLFAAAGTVCAFGTECGTAPELSGSSVFSIWTWDGGDWTRAASCTNSGRFVTSPGAVTIAGGRVIKPAVRQAAEFSANYGELTISFSMDGTVFGDGMTTEIRTIENQTYANSSTIRDLVPGHMVSTGDSGMISVSPLAEGATSAGILGADRVHLVTYTAQNNGTLVRGVCDFIPFRGGGGMFGVVRDPVDGYYRTLSAVDGALFMQATTNLWAWQPCGTAVAASPAGRYLAPSIAIDGSDMIVATGVAVGDVAADGDAATHLSFVRIPNFRGSFGPEEMARARILVADQLHGHIQSFWKASDGNWYSAGHYLKYSTRMGTRNTRHISTIACGGHRVWISEGQNNTNGGILELREDGRYRRWLDNMPVDSYFGNVACDPAGRHLFAYFDKTNAIWKCDLSTGKWKAFLDSSAATWDSPAHFAVASDGSLYTAGYNTNGGNYSIRHYNADGSHDRVLFSIGYAASGYDSFTGVALDEEGRRLFVATCYGRIRKFDLANGDACTELYNIGLKYNQTCGQLLYLDGTIYGTGHPGWVFAVDAETGALSVPFGRVYSAYGITAVGVTPEDGLTLIFK